ncbi:MAG: response regulator [Granulosicoccaceae bacterium]
MSEIRPVLLLEDDTFDVILLQRSLAAVDLPTTLHIVSDGEEALRALGLLQPQDRLEPAPAIAVLDINVPKISGFEVCRQIRDCALTRDLHVVFFSGSTSSNDEKLALAAGADHYFDKNKGPQSLLNHLQSLLPPAA